MTVDATHAIPGTRRTVVRALAPLQLAFICACGEPLIAWVGVESDGGKADAEALRPTRDAATWLRDAGSGDGALESPPDASLRCVNFPDLVQTFGGPVSNEDVRCESQPYPQCSIGDAGIGPVYAYTRTDGEPMLRAHRSYALSWPPPGKSPSFVLMLGDLSGSESACGDGAPLGRLTRQASSTGCVQLEPSEDHAHLRFNYVTLTGLGQVEFSLCPGTCDAVDAP
jgi:hypothetical protein